MKTKAKTLRKPVRTLSGVHVIAAALMPGSCPHGRCVYCPGGLSEGTPQSYVHDSPIVRKAIPLGYHPYLQVNSRLREYERLGHEPSKIELILIGGTFLSYPKSYQEWFVTRCLEALNRYPNPRPPSEASELAAVQSENEVAKYRCVGMTVETRPDRASNDEIGLLLGYGVTRVELGVQSVSDDVLRLAGRAHSISDVKNATRALRNAGLKICYHMMPGLPGSTVDRDLEAFEELFQDPELRPDMLKIYPTLVLTDTGLHALWKAGRYEPYSDEMVIELLVRIKRIAPRWVRINRIQREIPLGNVVAGLQTVNLRELVKLRLAEEGHACSCIRCREAGRAAAAKEGRLRQIADYELLREDYEASGGLEVFLSYEDASRTCLAGFIRLRIPPRNVTQPSAMTRTAVIRELHVYGLSVPIGSRNGDSLQHTGIGTGLLQRAEEIAASEFGCDQMLIISGIGARGYYRARGYARPNHSPYMQRTLA